MVGRMIVQALVWASLGGIVLPITLAIGAGLVSSVVGGCGPGDSGGCAMGMLSLLLVVAPVGAIAGAIYGIMVGRRPAAPATPR